jgi:hypothetical protein
VPPMRLLPKSVQVSARWQVRSTLQLTIVRERSLVIRRRIILAASPAPMVAVRVARPASAASGAARAQASSARAGAPPLTLRAACPPACTGSTTPAVVSGRRRARGAGEPVWQSVAKQQLQDRRR